MSRHRHMWEHHKIFNTSLSYAPASSDAVLIETQSTPKAASVETSYGPGKMGCTYELCAGIVDKKMSLQQIAQEEILEETGTHVQGFLNFQLPLFTRLQCPP